VLQNANQALAEVSKRARVYFLCYFHRDASCVLQQDEDRASVSDSVALGAHRDLSALVFSLMDKTALREHTQAHFDLLALHALH
jgi:hypothetical protein